MGSFHGIVNFNVDLWPVESTTSSIDLPWFSEVVESDCEGSFSLVPKLFISESFFRSGGQFHLKLEAE